MMITFSDFNNWEHLSNVVAVSNFAPASYTGHYHKALLPPLQLERNYRNGLYTDDEYRELYTHTVLDSLNPELIGRDLDGVVLVGYGHNVTTDHRHAIAEWFRKAGLECQEITNEMQ